MSPREVVLWRHGRTAYNSEGRFQGHLDVPLDAIGLAQAEAAAPYVAGLDPEAVLTSDLVRAQSTADVVAPLLGLATRPDPRLREADMGDWQGLTIAEVARLHPDQFAAWQRGEIRRGGESPAELADRALPAVLEADVERLLVVTHGGTARALIGSLLGLPQQQWSRLGPLGNCHWSHLRLGRHGWQLVAHNAGAKVAPADGGGTSQDAAAVAPAPAA